MQKDTNIKVLAVKMNEDQDSMLNFLVAEHGKQTGDFSRYRYLLSLMEKEYQSLNLQTA